MPKLSTLRARLRQSGARPKAERPSERRLAPPDWEGRMVKGGLGEYFVKEASFPPEYSHGGRPLMDLLAQRVDPIWMPELPAETDLSRLVFFDTETTGLAGGSGTIAFLVGIGFFDNDKFLLQQFFLHEPSGEAQLLQDAIERMRNGSALVTFNGKQFDVPVLQARATLRLRKLRVLEDVPHLDLLPHARRFWRGRLESCALSSLETMILGVRRTSEDVPGWAIPALYREYLSTGDASPLERVLYHNAEDILSMVSLAAEMAALYSLAPEEMQDGWSALAFAKNLHARGILDRAERWYRAAMQLREREDYGAYAGLSTLLKQMRRQTEAVAVWEEWHATNPKAAEPSVELAKHHEWRTRDYEAALRWAKLALEGYIKPAAAGKKDYSERQILKRIQRLEKKQKGEKSKAY